MSMSLVKVFVSRPCSPVSQMKVSISVCISNELVPMATFSSLAL